jgi:hypothetical protein
MRGVREARSDIGPVSMLETELRDVFQPTTPLLRGKCYYRGIRESLNDEYAPFRPPASTCFRLSSSRWAPSSIRAEAKL